MLITEEINLPVQCHTKLENSNSNHLRCRAIVKASFERVR